MKSPRGPECWNLDPQLVMLFWEVVEILGGRAEEQEVGHWGHALGLQLALASLPSFPACHEVSSFHPHRSSNPPLQAQKVEPSDGGLKLLTVEAMVCSPFMFPCQVFLSHDRKAASRNKETSREVLRYTITFSLQKQACGNTFIYFQGNRQTIRCPLCFLPTEGNMWACVKSA